MTITFFDRQDEGNPLNGKCISCEDELDTILRASSNREPFFCDFLGEGGFNILAGIGGKLGCVQYSSVDDKPPYLMALSPLAPKDGFVEFLIGDTPSPVPMKYCMEMDVIRGILLDFLKSGQRSNLVSWEGI